MLLSICYLAAAACTSNEQNNVRIPLVVTPFEVSEPDSPWRPQRGKIVITGRFDVDCSCIRVF